MNVYKYQIIKYLESKNFDTRELKLLPKEVLLSKCEHLNKNILDKFVNKRKSRENIIKYVSSDKHKITIDWNPQVCSL